MGVITHKTATAFVLTAGSVAAALAAASPASAGGIGDFLSPAFSTNCVNHDTVLHAAGATTAGTGAADGNLLGSPLNQCGGADLTPDTEMQNGLVNVDETPIGILGSASNSEA
ncbi:hypothetical protein [Streptomyces sp. NPDC002602]|uniref:hypothetical protein n=1 Tax=Streptomyces sp. NPDC002602 TaxID=3364654 RepID=UPI0036A89922